MLGVSRSASQEEIKKSYRRMARKYHPDVSSEPDAEERFKEVQRAYEALSDSQKRAAYDKYGFAGVESLSGAGFSGFEGFGGFADIFEDLFGGFGGGRRARRGPKRGADLRYDLTLEFEEAIFGVEKEIEVRRPEVCPTCRGSGAEPGTGPKVCSTCRGSGEVRQVRQSILGQFVNVAVCPTCNGAGEEIAVPCSTCHGRRQVMQTRAIKVSVPPGVDSETQIRLSGEGAPGAYGGPPGNLFVIIHVRKHKYFQRRGDDIFLDLQINVAQAALGDKVVVPTLDGEEEMVIEAGTQPGQVVKLKGRGVPRLDRSGLGSDRGRGDMHIIFQVAIPKKLTEKQRKLFAELGETMGKEVSPHSRGFWSQVKDTLGDVFGV